MNKERIPLLPRRRALQVLGAAAVASLPACRNAGQASAALAKPPAASLSAAFIAQPNAPTTLAAYTEQDWSHTEPGKQDWMNGLPDRMLKLLGQLRGLYYGNAVDQLEHSLQTATRAYRANADDETVLIALCHDIGKVISLSNHAGVGAELLQPFISDDNYHVLRTHTQFQARFWREKSEEYQRFQGTPWFDRALVFTNDWDQASMDAHYASLPLGHFEPLLREKLTKKRVRMVGVDPARGG